MLSDSEIGVAAPPINIEDREMSYSDRQLVKRSVELAKEKNPNGFNKTQLIVTSKEVFGGFGEAIVNPLSNKPIKTMDDVGNMGDAMAFIDGGYPAGMGGCYVVGLNGGCGLDCPVYLEGDCDNEKEVLANDCHSLEDIEAHNELY